VAPEHPREKEAWAYQTELFLPYAKRGVLISTTHNSSKRHPNNLTMIYPVLPTHLKRGAWGIGAHYEYAKPGPYYTGGIKR